MLCERCGSSACQRVSDVTLDCDTDGDASYSDPYGLDEDVQRARWLEQLACDEEWI